MFERMFVCLLSSEPFPPELGMVVHHDKAEYYANKNKTVWGYMKGSDHCIFLSLASFKFCSSRLYPGAKVKWKEVGM